MARKAREAKLEGLSIAANGVALKPGTPEYRRMIKQIAESVSDDEIPSFRRAKGNLDA